MQRVGVIGGGQLAWMMGEAARKLGIDLIIQTPHLSDPAVKIAADIILGSVDDAQATAKLADCCQVITFENEFINLEALKQLEGACFRPSLEALSPLLDKYHQRQYLQEIGLSVPRFTQLESWKKTGLGEGESFPAVLKVRRHGYDGQGTFILNSQDTLEAALKSLAASPVMVEEYIAFDRELAVMAARSVAGEVVVYPVVETYQQDGVCHWVMVPADIASPLQSEVERIARHLLAELQFVGVLGIELFLTEEGQLLVNEIAPRTHNSGHYTLDTCEISQFEMQLRAVADFPLVSPTWKGGGAVMVNLLGYEYAQQDYREKRECIAAIPSAHLHCSDKTESRPGRKLAHVTVLSESTSYPVSHQQLLETAKLIESLWYG